MLIENRYDRKMLMQLMQDTGSWYVGEGVKVFTEASIIVNQPYTEGLPSRVDDVSRLDEICFCVFTKGTCVNLNNMRTNRIEPGTIEYLGSGSLCLVTHVDETTRLSGVFVKPELVVEAMGGTMPLMMHQYAVDARVKADDETVSLFESMISTFLKLCRRDGEDSPEAKAMLRSIVFFCSSLFVDESSVAPSSRERELVEKFLRILNVSRGRIRKISEFAGELCVSDHYLSVTVKKISGYTVKEIIDKVVIAEIQMQLRQTDKSVAQIAEDMDFPNTSFMCNFFRKKVGVSPLKYRSGSLARA